MKKLIINESTASIAGLSNTTAISNTTQSNSTTTSSNSNINDALGKILPVIVGFGGLSMLFGKGLFGIDSGRNGLFGGFWGKLLGGSVLATVVPSLWSNEGIGDRLKRMAQKIRENDWLGAILAFLGLDSGADKVIKKTQQKTEQLALNKSTIEAKAKQFTIYAIPLTKVLSWMQKNGYTKATSLLYLTPSIAIAPAKLTLDTQKKVNQGITDFIAVLYLNDQKQVQIQIAQVANLVNAIDKKFANQLAAAFTTNKSVQSLNQLNIIQDVNTNISVWFDSCKNLVNKIKSIQNSNKGDEIVLKLFNYGMTKLCESHSLQTIELPAEIEESINNTTNKLKLIFEQSVQSISQILNDPKLMALKEDPTLNKFDEDIKLLDEKITNEYIKLIQMLLVNQDENGHPIYENPDTCIIYGQLQKQHYFYCRNRNNGYLTTNINQSVMFPGTDIKKIEKESPIEVSTDEHMSVDEALPILWNQYTKGSNKDLKTMFDKYKLQYKDVKDAKQLFKQFLTESDKKILPFKKEKRNIIGTTISETLKNFLIAVKLPQIMKMKKPGIKVNVYETNLAFIEKLKAGLKQKLNIDITKG